MMNTTGHTALYFLCPFTHVFHFSNAVPLAKELQT